MSTFNVDDLVVVRGQNDVMKVLEVITNEEDNVALFPNNDNPTTIHVSIGSEGSTDWFREDELEYVAAEEVVVVSTKFVDTEPSRPYQEIHTDICDMFAQVANYMSNRLDGENFTIRINTQTNGLSEDCNVEFHVCISYGSDVISDDLYSSARIACDRHLQNKEMLPRLIKFQHEVAV
jgi:hypothetical protein